MVCSPLQISQGLEESNRVSTLKCLKYPSVKAWLVVERMIWDIFAVLVNSAVHHANEVRIVIDVVEVSLSIA